MTKDNWEHRSANMLCKTCMFYAPKGDGELVGRCRESSPTMKGWPVMFPTDWCGAHKLDETKLEQKPSKLMGAKVDGGKNYELAGEEDAL